MVADVEGNIERLAVAENLGAEDVLFPVVRVGGADVDDVDGIANLFTKVKFCGLVKATLAIAMAKSAVRNMTFKDFSFCM